MTAHAEKPTITPERVAWFADYHRKHLAWGAFHIVLDDGNWKSEIPPDFARGEPGELEAIAWFNKLTPSQRQRLGRKAEDVVHTVVR